MTIDTSRLKLSTKGLIGIIFAFGGFMQIPAVSGVITPILAAHPRLTPFIGAFAGIYALLHTPEVEQALGIKTITEVKQTTETVAVAPAEGKS